jgi:hypothetical protein
MVVPSTVTNAARIHRVLRSSLLPGAGLLHATRVGRGILRSLRLHRFVCAILVAHKWHDVDDHEREEDRVGGDGAEVEDLVVTEDARPGVGMLESVS